MSAAPLHYGSSTPRLRRRPGGWAFDAAGSGLDKLDQRARLNQRAQLDQRRGGLDRLDQRWGLDQRGQLDQR
ncbi:hypothetical protein [Gordonia jacobaea]|uniref:hypothetical protein n=1 Tax=Gordonia jacobaea TaxID=122202 RepID=UPI003D7387F7